MSPELKAFLKKNTPIIESEEFEQLICPEMIRHGILEEYLDLLFNVHCPMSTGVVTDQLIKYYILNNPKLTAEQKETLQLKICYLINKHQATFVSTLIDEFA